ncbi:MAG: HEAT repeat domain-containing protein [Candidatus Acidiferrales bacterium]
MNTPDETSAAPSAAPGRRRPPFLLMLFLVAMVVVPFLFWRGTWFGRTLSEQETSQYLSLEAKPRQTQHALVQIGERILRGDSSAKRWYGELESLVAHPQPEVRSTLAWVMGQDNQAPAFHAALLRLLEDSDPLVRRNAALALVRFGDAGGRIELRQMLVPFPVTATQGGTVDLRLNVGDTVNTGTLLARIDAGGDEPIEVRSPVPGRLEDWAVMERSPVAAGATLALISPSEEEVWEALRALFLVGEQEDVELIEPFARGKPRFSDRLRQQAESTVKAIRQRSE